MDGKICLNGPGHITKLAAMSMRSKIYFGHP